MVPKVDSLFRVNYFFPIGVVNLVVTKFRGQVGLGSVYSSRFNVQLEALVVSHN